MTLRLSIYIENLLMNVRLWFFMGNRHHKALWDSGACKCVISFNCYQSIPTKYKTELYPSRIKPKAANGTFITNKGECDLTFVIGDERFTFSFPLLRSIIPTNHFGSQFCQSIPHRHLVGSR